MKPRSLFWRVGLTGLATALLMGLWLDRSVSTNGGTIHVTTTAAGLADDGLCSLAEAVYAANLDLGVAPAGYAGSPTLSTTGCEAGSGDDVIELQAGATYQFSAPLRDPINPYGPTATPVVFSKIVLEGRGATLVRPNPGRDFSGTNFRAFAVATYGIFDSAQRLLTIPGNGIGELTVRDAFIKGFTARGGDARDGGGGGLGAGGAIFVHRGTLNVEQSTFVDNGAAGGNGAASGFLAGGGGGGMGGNGGEPGPGGAYFGGGGGGGAQFNGGRGGFDTFAGGIGGGGGGTYLPGRNGLNEEASSLDDNGAVASSAAATGAIRTSDLEAMTATMDAPAAGAAGVSRSARPSA